MRILEIISGGGVDGANTHCRELCLRLRDRGHQVTLMCRPGAWIETRLAGSGIEVVHSTLKRKWGELGRVARWIRERRFDVLHTHQSSAHFFGVVERYITGVPVVASAHSTHIQPHFWFNDHVIATSEAAGRYHRRLNLVPRRRMSTIYSFLDAQEFAAIRASDGAEARRTLGLPPDALVLMGVGTIGHRKNQAALAAMLARLAPQFPQARLVLIGSEEADYKQDLAAKIAELGIADRILFAGKRNDVRQLLAAADVMVLASRTEVLPMAILEAMAAAKPVVAYDVGGIGEMIVDGVTGGLVRFNDERRFEEHLRSLAADPALRKRQGLAGAERLIQRFSPESEVPRIEAVFQQVIAAGARPRVLKPDAVTMPLQIDADVVALAADAPAERRAAG